MSWWDSAGTTASSHTAYFGAFSTSPHFHWPSLSCGSSFSDFCRRGGICCPNFYSFLALKQELLLGFFLKKTTEKPPFVDLLAGCGLADLKACGVQIGFTFPAVTEECASPLFLFACFSLSLCSFPVHERVA